MQQPNPRYKNVENIKQVKYSWQDTFLRKNVSSTFFKNPKLNDFMASIERMFAMIASSIKYIEKYFNI